MVSNSPALGSPSQGGVYAVAIVLILASIVVVAMRFAARHSKRSGWKADDWLIFTTMLLLWGLGMILIYGAARGVLGTHTMINPKTGGIIPTWKESEVSKLENLLQLLAIIALGTLKSSVVLLYRRIFITDLFRKVSLVVLIIIVAWAVAFFFATLFECDGENYNLLWLSLTTFKKYCGRYKYIQLGHCVSDVATDLIVLALPLPSIWALQMKIKNKIVISFMFLLGLLTTAAGTARLVIVTEDLFGMECWIVWVVIITDWELLETTSGARDVRGAGTNIMVWTYVEVGVGIVAACLPTMRQFVNQRSIESVIASVRSVVSLHSFGSSSRSALPGNGLSKTEASDHSGKVYQGPASQTKSDASGSTTSDTYQFSKTPLYPETAILRQDSFTLHRGMAEKSEQDGV